MRSRVAVLGVLLASVLVLASTACKKPEVPATPQGSAPPSVTVQLNWLHDPTFVAQYELTRSTKLNVTVREGGPNVSPLGEVLAGRAHFAIVGSDIFLKYLAEHPTDAGKSELVCVFVDFQRNPVGWVLHPDVAKELNLADSVRSDPKALNAWVAEQIRQGRIKVGDKRGTESTSVWLQWRAREGLPAETPVVPVGFDPAIVLSAPRMLYPVYLNEQPFKLSERTASEGKGDVVVVDPAVDGIELYGNVLVARRDLDRALVEEFQNELRRAWENVRAESQRAVELVRSRYIGVSSDVVTKQVKRTLDFVFGAGVAPGQMDVRPDGKWATTLQAVQAAGIVGDTLQVKDVLAALVPPK